LKFANGGIVPRAANGLVVPGNSYSGDSILARVNSGEMILNQSQQSNLLNILGSKFYRNTNGTQVIKVVGEAKMGGRDFVWKFKNEEQSFTKLQGLNF